MNECIKQYIINLYTLGSRRLNATERKTFICLYSEVIFNIRLNLKFMLCEMEIIAINFSRKYIKLTTLYV